MASSIPGELISLPSSGSIPELPHVAKHRCFFHLGRFAYCSAFSAESVLRHYRPTRLADRLRRTGDCGRWRRAAEELDEAPQVLSGCGQ